MAPHEALAVFLGDWWAEGSSYTGEDKSPDQPRAGEVPWRSVESGRWHSGGYFLLLDQRANGPFDTFAVMGWDPDQERYFARTVENHGFCRDYTLTVEGNVWRYDGPLERATHTFSDDGRTQTCAWEQLVDGHWLPLCDRVAHRVD